MPRPEVYRELLETFNKGFLQISAPAADIEPVIVSFFYVPYQPPLPLQGWLYATKLTSIEVLPTSTLSVL
jgi:hypothetical protein